jgi:hypothetical protein
MKDETVEPVVQVNPGAHEDAGIQTLREDGLYYEDRPKFGVETESCSAKRLQLHRFSNGQKVWAADQNSRSETILNPFGDPWSTRKMKNPFIPTMTGSCYSYVKREVGYIADPLHGSAKKPTDAAKAFQRYSYGNVSDLHYDETIGRLAQDMPAFRDRKERYLAYGLKKRFIGYAVLNFNDQSLFGKDAPLPESYFVHKPERSRKRENRVSFRDGSTLIASGDVFDIRKPSVRTAICDAVMSAMKRNNVDGVLIDYAVRRFAFGAPSLVDELPASWFEKFQESQFALIQELYARCLAEDRLLFLNGVMLDSITVTQPKLINLFIKHCHGMMWEQPFRFEWRPFKKGEDDYYRRLEKFFDLFVYYKKMLIVKCGSYRFHATEDVDPSWNTRFLTTDSGIERHLADYNLCFFLLYYNRFFNRLYYTNPTEVFDVFTSEAFYSSWDSDIGEAVTGRIEYAEHVHFRVFENAIVFVNNRLQPMPLSPKKVFEGLEGPLPRLVLKPLSGTIWFTKGPNVQPEWKGLPEWVFSNLRTRLRI